MRMNQAETSLISLVGVLEAWLESFEISLVEVLAEINLVGVHAYIWSVCVILSPFTGTHTHIHTHTHKHTHTNIYTHTLRFTHMLMHTLFT